MGDDNNEKQSLDSMGNPIEPLNLSSRNNDKPNDLNISDEMPPANPLAPDSSESPLPQGGMPTDGPIGMDSQPMGMGGQPMSQMGVSGQPMGSMNSMGQPMGQSMGSPMNQSMGSPMNQSMPGADGFNQFSQGYGGQSMQGYSNQQMQGYGGQPMTGYGGQFSQGYSGMPMYDQPIDPYGPSMTGMRPMNAGDNSQKSKILFVVGAVVVAVLLLVGMIVLPNLLRGGNGGEGGDSGGGSSDNSGGDNGDDNGNKNNTKDSEGRILKSAVESFCKSKNYQIADYQDEDTYKSEKGYNDKNTVDAIRCYEQVKIKSDSALMVEFFQYDRKALKIYSSDIEELLSDSVIVSKSDDYVEFYLKEFYTPYYYIVDGDRSFIAVFENADDLEEILKAVRGEDSRNTYFREHGFKDNDNQDLKDGGSSGDPKATARDVARRNDVSRVDTSLVQYQTNNSTKSMNLPLPGKWAGKSDFKGANDCGSNTACMFVRDYLKSSATKNEFTDPDGSYYSMIIAKDYATSEDGTLGGSDEIGMNDNSTLIAKDGGYTIGGKNPFKEHVIYVVPGGRCDGSIVKKSQKRHFAILYYLEDETTYCMDDQ